ncbi:tRNA modification GTPase TrmE [Gloeomargarita lithophora Alchichica-D10]|uniref:tRNA modification GTPase MnmE n=1 Tax=Gloeomargarita lithophora Alchichica-D10 TaxID=1188229 RepID=A0A1J0A8S4_9CYAN|nr:tRNA uridine-5-carboxymethylaminomethyl(34) synthesis GTPase MnmE [Gloeomargarita lithophora]APB32325.1 tRNA modification GTPase TrmE [Gloeomargarita lithophora Alchichica-D10]
MLDLGDTIAAIATAVAPEQGSIAIVRLSGGDSVKIAHTIFHAPGKQIWESHRILYGYIQNATGQTIDEALLLLMLAPRSYTREDVVEFHCHGGMMTVQKVLNLCIQNGARLARPGEFTLRAVLNGRLDLTQAEAIADLIGAKSSASADNALAGLQGKLSQYIQKLRHQCLDLLAELEARIDFDEDLVPLNYDHIQKQIFLLLEQVHQLLATAERGELLRRGIKVAIVGRPNVGKSSLLNAWSQTERAIVTDLPGTTRDVVDAYLVVQGIPVEILDTAGIRSTDDPVEQIGIDRSRQAIQKADIILWVVDALTGWTKEDERLYQELEASKVIAIVNKIDLTAELPQISQIKTPIIYTSALNHTGIDQLESVLIEQVSQGKVQQTNVTYTINQRQQTALLQVQQALQNMQTTITQKLPIDFWTIDLRTAIQALGSITGEEITESVLDRIFSKFCIGK